MSESEILAAARADVIREIEDVLAAALGVERDTDGQMKRPSWGAAGELVSLSFAREAAARLSRVQALADEWASIEVHTQQGAARVDCGEKLRAALEGTT